MSPISFRVGALLLISALAACDNYDDDSYTGTPVEPVPAAPVPQLILGTDDIAPAVAQFRTALGEPRNGGTIGPATSGRREINWDGVPAEFNNADNRFPAAFFNTTVRLGAIMSTPGTGFRNDSSLFGDLDSGFRSQFSVFSPNKLFTVVGSNIVDVEFQLAGQPTPANVAGFGAVFVDVDLPGRTTLEYFDRTGRRLATVAVPPRSGTTSLSFAGARFADAVIARVRITLGNGTIGAGRLDISMGGSSDIVVLDDFFYTEPQPVR
jgi:hypothetical protein